MYNFFVDNSQINEKKVVIENQDAKHISTVLRMRIGEEITVCNKEDGNKYLAKIESITKEKVECAILEKLESTESKIRITLFQGIPKADKMEFVLQKAVELGAQSIVPLEMKNCVSKIKDEEKKLSRWKLIAEAAAKQSKRNIIPKIEKVENINVLKDRIKEFDLVIVAYEDEKTKTIKDILSKNKNISKIAIVVGPEGGIDKEEIKPLLENGAIAVSLGKRILRTETAPLAMLSMIMYEFEL